MNYADKIKQKLTKALEPISLDIKDESNLHVGHQGHDPRGETHFFVKVVSAKFEGYSLLERHKMIYSLLADEMKERVHALRLKTMTKNESFIP